MQFNCIKIMAENCNHDCSSCSQSCSDRAGTIQKEKLNDLARATKIIGVVSGKGGVGKSFATSNIAVSLARKGYKVGILDADITGPSIPSAFDIKGDVAGSELGMYPAVSKLGIQVISINMLLDNPTDPVIWRGAMIVNAVKQFFTDVIWDVDYLLIDVPPGTSDVALSVFQSLPVDGVVMVSTPQGLVEMIVEKAVKMADIMNIPVIGLVENMSFLKCPNCDTPIEVFGKSKASEIASKYGIGISVKLPIDSKYSSFIDSGKVEELEIDELEPLIEMIEASLHFDKED